VVTGISGCRARRCLAPLAIAFLLLSFVSLASGDVTLSLPLEGHYRAGRYMPLRITAHGEYGVITLLAHGAVPTEIEAAGDLDVVVPWLTLSESVREPAWESSSTARHPVELPLKALADDEKLVAFSGEDSDIAGRLFPGKKIVPLALDVSKPLLQPATAWESLDAIILTPAMAARIEDQIADIIGSGTNLAIRSKTPPDTHWSWKQMGEYWVLRFDPAGPTSALNADAYAPTYTWERGWPLSFRRQVIFGGILFCILGTGVLLWRSRWALAAFIAVSAVAAGSFTWWYARQSPVLEMDAGLLIRGSPIAQYDLWNWRAVVRSTPITFPSSGSIHPIFASIRQPEQLQFRVVCASDGNAQYFRLHLDPGQSQAFLKRQVSAGSQRNLPPLQPAVGPFSQFATDVYLRPGNQIAGQIPPTRRGEEPSTPVIVIGNSK
jgi:hypothetical protein